MKNKIKLKYNFIVSTPDEFALGGVSLFCNTLKKNMSQEFLFFHRKSDSYPQNKGYFKKISDQIFNIISFVKTLIINTQIKGVIINVSFSKKSIFRELIYVSICRIFLKPTVVFFHGWKKSDVKFFKTKGKIFLKLFLSNCKHIFVLSKEFKKDLIDLGMKNSITITTTMFDDSDLIKPNNSEISNKYDKLKKMYTAIFLSRIEREKGIYEAIEIIKWLNNFQKEYTFKLSVIGDGKEFKNLVQLNDPNISFYGFVGGPSKYKLLLEGDLLLFPTYGEGFPITITEAMACGLPIFTRPVGGIRDFFRPEMGFCSESLSPDIIGNAILDKLSNSEFANIAFYNVNYAWEKFAASKYVKNFENEINRIFGHAIN